MTEALPSSPPPSSGNGEPPADLSAIAARTEEIASALLARLGFEARLAASVGSNEIRLRLLVEEPARLIGRRGAMINDLQFLMSRILQRLFKEMPRLYLDVVAPEAPPPPQISERLQDFAERVRRWGDPVDLGALDATERQAAVDAFARDRELEVVPAAAAPNAAGLQPMRLQLRSSR
ncbi:MAG: hypothetical protein IT578_01125 [Verrucomicrobiae bacterium]|nr:hypothetical protein [Verrucomicrobiae bacterium]